MSIILILLRPLNTGSTQLIERSQPEPFLNKDLLDLLTFLDLARVHTNGKASKKDAARILARRFPADFKCLYL